MSEKQLTVAELMARAGKEDTSVPSGRRRRRSVEEGGISVAELTGNIPAVKAKPVEGKHTSEPLDGEPVSASPVTPQKTQQPASVQPSAPKKPAPAPTTSSTTDTGVTKSVSLGSDPSETVVLSVVQEDAQVRLTTGTFPAVKKPAAKPAPTPVKKLDTTPTSEWAAPAVSAGRPVPGAHEAVKKNTGAARVPSPATPEAKASAVAEDVVEETVTQVTPAPANAPLSESETKVIALDPATLPPEPEPKGVFFAHEDSKENSDEAHDHKGQHESEDEKSSQSISVFSVVLMSIVGIVLGAVTFKGFEYLWSHVANNYVVAAAAVAVILLVVGVVYLMKTARTKSTMALAAVVGAVMTFGPLLVV